ncbi:4Fe-4S dicluster domain-containing protein [Desulfovermiculus halophilus]|jgi:NAD-dependent dihydropyrimidine dehydrogenase PreA subunit|uniref:4Fe-4S dicluster domain-containing protein n=1 Tax=Desulfovermiculus halophilus TaxID=339722 RepID=UPI0004837362|nr:4Fe-4S binding protein [Desulfovermiculus halophilus]
MGIFINLRIDNTKCIGVEKCGQCINVCPVNIFKSDNDAVAIIEENEDECTLCERCLEECGQNAIEIIKLYA